MHNKDFEQRKIHHERKMSNLSDFYFEDEKAKLEKMALQTPDNEKKSNLLPKNHEEENNSKGFALLVFSVFMYSIANLISKYLSINYPNVENLAVNLFRGIYLIIIAAYFIHAKNLDYMKQIQRNKYKTQLLLIRCLFGATSNITLFAAFRHMRISSAFTIFCTYPIFVSVISVIYLKSNISNFDIVSYLACLLSVIFISKPAFIFTDNSGSNDTGYGVFIAFFSAITNAIGVVINKSIAFDFDYLVSTFFFGVFFFVESAVCLPFTENGLSSITFTSFLYISLLSVVFFVGVSMFVLSLNLGNPVKILPGTYFGIVFSLIYNSFIFGKPTDLLDLLGSGMIIIFNTLGSLGIKF